MPKPIEQAKRDEAMRRYGEGQTAREIAEDLGICPQSVYRWARQARGGKFAPTDPNRNGLGAPRKLTPECTSLIEAWCRGNPDITAAHIRCRLIRAGHNLSEITIGNWMRANGLSKKERMKQRAEKWQDTR